MRTTESVAGKCVTMLPRTGWLVNHDVPKLPRTTPASQSMYLTANGSFRPSWTSFARNWAALAVSPRMLRAMLADEKFSRTNVTLDTTKRTKMPANSRFPMNWIISNSLFAYDLVGARQGLTMRVRAPKRLISLG